MGSQYRLLTLFADGGFMMYPLVLCSMIAFGVMIAKFFTLHIAHTGTNQCAHRGRRARSMSGDIEGAIRGLLVNTAGPASAILLAGLRRIQGQEAQRG